MEKKLKYLIMLLAVLLIPKVSSAQDVIDVPDQINGNPIGALRIFIQSDTLDNGERAHPDAYYRLQRGHIYWMDKTMNIDFNLNLIADDDDPSNPTRPPMIVRALQEDGTYLRNMFEVTTDNVKIYVKNLLFQGVPSDEVIRAANFYLFRLTGDKVRFESRNCIYNGITGQCIRNQDYGLTNFTLILKDNYFRNNVGLTSPYSGYTYVGGAKIPQDSIIYHNNTFLNISDYMIYSKELAKTFEFFHNTGLHHAKGSLRLPYLVNARFEDNLIYNYQTTGQDSSHWVSKHYAIVQIRDLDSALLAKAGLNDNTERKVIYKNNVYGWNDAVKNFWTTYNLHDVPWMGPITDSLFGHYDNFVDENNVEIDNVGFDAAMMTALDDLNLAFNTIYRTTKEGYADRIYAPDGKKFDLAWPLPEKCTYTNSEVLTHGGGGFPVGDLNWYPDKKAQWEEWLATGIERDNKTENIPSEYQLSQNYPNPFNPTTKISFSIPKATNVELSVFNILGQKVATLVNKELAAGSYKYDFDASNLTSGIYFYKLQAKDYSQVRKMMLLK